jgi:hypothetical protein
MCLKHTCRPQFCAPLYGGVVVQRELGPRQMGERARGREGEEASDQACSLASDCFVLCLLARLQPEFMEISSTGRLERHRRALEREGC